MAWVIGENGLPTETDFIDIPENYIEKPYPLALWRIDDTVTDGRIWTNYNRPYNLLMRDVANYKLSTVHQMPYITVHSHLTKQDDFDNNGLAVLQPTACEISETLNGDYSLSLTHPVDDSGKWSYLREMCYIKAMGQIFRINIADFNDNGKKKEVKINAIHAFYIWNDFAVYPESFVQFESVNGKTSVESLINGVRKTMMTIALNPEQGIPQLTYTSDITDINSMAAYEKWGKIGGTDGIDSVSNFVLGSDGLIANFGGELYRDNFYFSIRKKMEGSSDNAFNIHIGHNLRGIRRKIDISTSCTYLMGVNNHGEMFAVSYTPTASSFIPHHITRVLQFQYDEPSLDRLTADTMRYWYQHGLPLISYTIDLEDVENNDEFKEFTGKPNYKVGNSGTIYDEILGAPVKLKVTKTKINALTRKVTSVTFGSSRQIAGYNANTQLTDFDLPVFKTSYNPLRDINGSTLVSSDGYRLVVKSEV